MGRCRATDMLKQPRWPAGLRSGVDAGRAAVVGVRNRVVASPPGLASATADGYIAAVAAANGFAVATRDTIPFEAAGVTVVDPRLA